MVLSSFLDTFQKIADAASNTKGKLNFLQQQTLCHLSCNNTTIKYNGMSKSRKKSLISQPNERFVIGKFKVRNFLCSVVFLTCAEKNIPTFDLEVPLESMNCN